MATHEPGPTDEQVEQVIGNLLRCGVLAAALVVVLGGIIYLARHGGEPVKDRGKFEPVEEEFRGPERILVTAWSLRGRGLIQLGLLLLIATPGARVVFSVFAFARQRDHVYVVITLIVL